MQQRLPLLPGAFLDLGHGGAKRLAINEWNTSRRNLGERFDDGPRGVSLAANGVVLDSIEDPQNVGAIPGRLTPPASTA